MRNKGITLIALVVTIVVLVILGGVSVYLVLGQNGIIARAQQAKEDTLIAQNEEQAKLGQAGNMIDDVVTSSRDTITLTLDQYNNLVNRITNLENKAKSSTLLWEGHTRTIGTTYNFTDASYDVDNYDYILIEYTQNDVYIHSTMIRKESITKERKNDIGLWGYSTRFMMLHFIDNGFVVDVNNTDSSSYYIYVNRIIGINL